MAQIIQLRNGTATENPCWPEIEKAELTSLRDWSAIATCRTSLTYRWTGVLVADCAGSYAHPVTVAVCAMTVAESMTPTGGATTGEGVEPSPRMLAQAHGDQPQPVDRRWPHPDRNGADQGGRAGGE